MGFLQELYASLPDIGVRHYGYVCLHADIEDLADITVYLHPLGRTTVIHLGLVLGLDYNRLRPLIDSLDFLTDRDAGWVAAESGSGAKGWSPNVEETGGSFERPVHE